MIEIKAPTKYVVLNILFIISLVISNVVSAKVLHLGPLQVPGATLCYCITFLCTDIIGELYGEAEANKTVRIGFFCQCVVSLLIWKFFLASILAYIVSQSWNVWVFHKLRDKYIQKHGSVKGGRWIWNNVSTMTSQLIDTIIFILLAFWGTMPNIWVMAASQYLLKLILAALDTPVFYLLTREETNGK